MEWLYLFAAIVFEVGGTTSMKLTEGFSKPLFIIPMAVGYALAFALLALALKRIDVGTAYAIWSGVGTALVALIGIFWFRDAVSALKLVSLGLIVVGVVGLRLAGGTME
jgi:small multidrug resistance pump